MSEVASTRTSIIGAALFSAVIACLLFPVGLMIMDAIAETPPVPVVSPDPLSDSVAATAAEFRVDESGAATYSIPIYAVPGTAGVTPKLSLNYSSQGGYGPLGKGWSIGGLSSISRCRATREAGDFIAGGVPGDGQPRPINYTASDRYCLDGQRLVNVADTPACAAVSGMAKVQLRTEIESFQRVCAYTPSSGTSGVAFFTVERKDGSISWYGDRVGSAAQNLGFGGYFNSTAPGKESLALLWAQTRFQDSTGNHIDFVYTQNAGGVIGEHLLREVRYTGKVALPGQTAPARVPYARVVFTYTLRVAQDRGKGFQSGGILTQAHRLDAITHCNSLTSCTPAEQARYYKITYTASPSGSGLDVLSGIQECRDNGMDVCAQPTVFEWSSGKHEFATYERPADLPIGSISAFRGFKMADIDGDGRQDFVYLRTDSGSCGTDWIVVGFARLDTAGRPTYDFSSTTCLPARIRDRGDGGWHLFDYNGDGRDDLFVSGLTVWHLYASQGYSGAAFNTGADLMAGIPVPSQNGSNDQVQLADLNGDSLTDIVYPANGALRARIMRRSGASYAFGAEAPVHVDEASFGPIAPDCHQPNVECTRYVAGALTPKTNFMQMADFNGDSASDLLLRVSTTVRRFTGGPGCVIPVLPPQPSMNEDGAVALPYVLNMDKALANVRRANDCWQMTLTDRLHAFAILNPAATSLTLSNYGDLSPGNPASLTFGDTNADGLTDVFVRPTTNSDWYSVINTGSRFNTGVSMGLSDFLDHARFADVSGDGRSDLLYVVNPGNQRKFYNVRYALPGGGYGAGQNMPGGNNATLCEGGGCDHNQRVPIFGDLDGDGNVDFMSIKMDNDPDLIVSRARPEGRFIPRDVIVKVTNGLGAVTQITYGPLTNKDLYRRDHIASRNTLNWGRGSPVLDLLVPSYVVARAASSSPQSSNPNALATVHYRYGGGKIQAGGRGFLGFEQIVTFDPNHAQGYVITGTTYAQHFPYVGMPLSTGKRVVSGAYAVPSCLAGTINDSCFAIPGSTFPGVGGTIFSESHQQWEADAEIAGTAYTAFAPGVQAPLHVRTIGTQEKLIDPFNGGQTSRVDTAFDYGAYGDVVLTAVDTFTGASTSAMSTIITSNTYALNNPAKWRLGRLNASSVTHRRPGLADVVRISSFNYDMADSATGLLTEERTQSGGGLALDSRKLYSLDDFGNRTGSVTCLPSTSSCDGASLQFHPSTLQGVHRYSRVVYDARGQFPVETFQPFWNGSGASEHRTQRVNSRNIFGNVTSAIDVNGVQTLAVTGALGRDYFAWGQTAPGTGVGDIATGIRTLTTYRWCGTGSNQVTCPAGARFRQQVLTTEAPGQWMYFDVLGRPIMKAVATFNEGVSSKDITATCTAYEAAGKPVAVSNPFFLPGTQGSNGPVVPATTCSSISEQLWTTTTYDLLGRPIRITTPDVGGTSIATTAYTGLKTTVTDARGNATAQTRNGKGELVRVEDANGLVSEYAYIADGNLQYVRRNAGRGWVENRFWYDALGRKIQQNDPDTGMSTFEYNALGELVSQTDADGGKTEHWHDARGRIWRKIVRTGSDVVESQSNYVYDTADYGLGQAAGESITGTYTGWEGQAGAALNFSRTYAYDAMGRPTGGITTIDGTPYTTAAAYDARGRVWKGQDASGRWSKTSFTTRGFTRAVCNSSAADTNPACPNSADSYLATLETDARGQVIRERRGNNAALDVTRSYWGQTGRIASICAGNATTCSLMDEGYGWDGAGNLTSHQKETRYLESFAYDRLNRLSEGRLLMQDGVTANTVVQQIHYDALGNICRRMTLGWATRQYTYTGRAGCGLGGTMNSTFGSGGTGAYGAHQISSLVGTDTYFQYYDPRGNQTLNDGAADANDRRLLYTADGMAHEARQGSNPRIRFWYGPDGQRYKRNDGTKVTLYLGNVEIVKDGGVVTTRRTIAGALLQTVVGTAVTNHYLFHDQLGSLVRITNAAGAVISSMDFLALGGRRNTANQYANGAAPSLTTRGFTGHEMVDGLNIVHMNGRIYDTYQGRFLQADPLVQASGNAQSWNAYAYAFNNPLAYTDPTGMFSWRQVLGIAIAVVGTWVTAGMDGGFFAKLGMAIAFGAASGYVATGTLRGAVTGAFTAGLTFGVGWAANVYHWGAAATVAAQAVTGGVIETLQGGNFGNGFLSAGLTAAFMPHAGHRNTGVRAVQGALIGGTISDLTGGKFANGAVSGAIQGAMSGRQMPESDEAISIEYGDKEYVGKFAKTPAERQAFARAMVRRGNLGDPSKVTYVDSDPGSYMTAFPSGAIEVYRPAFETFDYYSFGSSLYHEYNHLARYAVYQKAGYTFGPRTQPHYMMEAEAYKLMLSNKNPFYSGTTKTFQYLMRENDFFGGYGALTPANQQRVQNNQFNCAIGGC